MLVESRAEDGESKVAKDGHEPPRTESDTAFHDLQHFPNFTEELSKSVADKALEIQLKELFDKEGCSKRMQKECSHPSANVLCQTLNIPQTCRGRFLTEYLPKLFEETAHKSPTKECCFLLAKSNPHNDTFLTSTFSFKNGYPQASICTFVNNTIQFEVVCKDFNQATYIFVEKLTEMIKLYNEKLFLWVFGGLNVLDVMRKVLPVVAPGYDVRLVKCVFEEQVFIVSHLSEKPNNGLRIQPFLHFPKISTRRPATAGPSARCPSPSALAASILVAAFRLPAPSTAAARRAALG